MKKILLVRSVPPSFRRAGMAFTQTPTPVDKAELTAEQITALESEPNLVVTEKTVENEAPEGGAEIIGVDWADKPDTTAAAVQVSGESDNQSAADTTSKVTENKPDKSGSGVTLTDVVEAIKELNPDDADHWTAGGQPQVKVLEGLVNGSVSASLRDEAFDVFSLMKKELAENEQSSSDAADAPDSNDSDKAED